MKTSQLMSTDLVTLDADATLDVAEDLMQLKRVRHLPVLRNGELVGLVSQRDLFLAGVSSVLEFRRAAPKEQLARIRIDKVMATNLITIGSDADIEDAVQRLLDHKIGCLPVVDSGKLVGLLSETDCLRYLRRILEIADVKHRLAVEDRPIEIS